MTKLFTISAILLIATMLNAQSIYNDFDGNQNVDFIGWPNVPAMVANPDQTGINTSANVGEWQRSQEQWAHVYGELADYISFDSSSIFQLKVYSPIACDVLFKLEDAANAGIFVEVSATVSAANVWEQIEFDFAGSQSGIYNKVVIFFDFSSTTDNLFYFDDIVGPSLGIAVGPKPLLAGDVQDNFENDGWSTINTWKFQDPDLVDITIIADPVEPTNQVVDYNRTGVFEWTNTQFVLEHRMDLSEKNLFDLKVYFPSSNDYTGDLAPTAAIKLQNSLLGGNAYTTQTELIDTVILFDQWLTLTFDFSSIADSVNYDQVVVQFGGEGHFATGQFYFDDIELYSLVAGPKPLLAADVQDNFENDGYGTINDWKFQDPDLVDLTIVADPVDANNNVAEYNRSGSFEWTNAQFILDHRMDLTSKNIFSIDVYFPSTNDYTGDLAATTAIKLQNSLMGGNAWASQTEIVNTVSDFDQWVTLQFDFSTIPDSVNYDQVVVQLGGEGHSSSAMFYFDNIVLAEPSAIGENNFETIQLSPNPASDFLNINNSELVQSIEIYNILGKKINIQELISNRLNISNLDAGLYFIRIQETTGKVFSGQFLKN